MTHADELDAIIEEWTHGRNRYDVMERCQREGVPAGAVQNAADLANRDPQLRSSEFFGTTEADNWGDYGIDKFPALFDGQRPPRCDGVRQVGEDTFAVLGEVLGLNDDQIAELVVSGALT